MGFLLNFFGVKGLLSISNVITLQTSLNFAYLWQLIIGQ